MQAARKQTSRVCAALRKYWKHSSLSPILVYICFSVSLSCLYSETEGCHCFSSFLSERPILGSGAVCRGCGARIGRLSFEETDAISGSLLPQIGRFPATNDPCFFGYTNDFIHHESQMTWSLPIPLIPEPTAGRGLLVWGIHKCTKHGPNNITYQESHRNGSLSSVYESHPLNIKLISHTHSIVPIIVEIPY